MRVASAIFFFMFYHVLVLVFKQKITDFDEICEEIERETERVTGNNKVCLDYYYYYNFF